MAADPSYVELGVPDIDAAHAFYGALFGWVPEGPGQVQTGTLPVGMHGGDPNAHFEVFFTVEDLGASLSRVVELGGSAVGEVHDEGAFGRWSECQDDQGVRFGLRQLP